MSLPFPSSSKVRISPSREGASLFARDLEVNVIPHHPRPRHDLFVVSSSEIEDEEDCIALTSVMARTKNVAKTSRDHMREQVGPSRGSVARDAPLNKIPLIFVKDPKSRLTVV
ncbi:hypothetical protein CFOL_v3_22848 [Cephalotus follicularis]|uniref:Uncharacterized protein n=1 Tax=Cephalotus follicularis TaxID=3775 RepID=A0A1Q3CH12_CEPFO|nr:hypothetical protein CFOL_v3_22848 [Cephalotus follicularis]